MENEFKFENYKEVPIDKDKWDSLNRLLFDASRNDEGGERLRTLFSERSEEYKEEKLAILENDYKLIESDLHEIHDYLESMFHDSPLRFWWW